MIKSLKKESKADIQNLEKRAFKNIYDVSTHDGLFGYLKIWWCNFFKRPSKDPLLQEYTFEELIIEYFEQNLFDNKGRYAEIKESWLLNAPDDDEWYKRFETEVGPITKAGDPVPEEVHEEF